MKDKKEEIPIFFSIDDNYAPYTCVALKSIMENANKEYHYKIIILYQNLAEEDRKNLMALENENFDIQFVYMKDGMETITDRVENRLRCDYFTLTIFFRLFISDMFPEYEKGIYVDSDIVVPGDISQLYHIDLGDNIIGASTDHSIQGIPELTYYVENAVGIPRKEYINSGILLMNLKLMREKHFSEHFLRLLNKFHFDSIAPDQDYINAMCHGKILYLDEVWDAMPAEGKEPLKNPKLIHYNLFQKPWCYDNIAYEDYFWKYAKKTCYYETILDFKKHYSEEQKESDRKCLEILVKKGASLPDTEDITFKKIYETGRKIRV